MIMEEGTVLEFHQTLNCSVSDDYGGWAYTSGTVKRDGKDFGWFKSQRRYTPDSRVPSSCEPITTTIMVSGKPLAESITLHGTWESTASYFGNELGSVIGASPEYQEIIGATYSRTESTLVIKAAF